MGWKLTMGRLRDAWWDYSEDRSALASFPAGPPIFLGGTHRSGTTWVGSMLAEPGLWYLHEPFNPNKKLWGESFTYAAPGSSRPDIEHYVTSLLQGKYRTTSLYRHTDHYLMPLRVFRPPVRRVLIKDPLACLLSGFLAEKFSFQTRILFRHPAGFVSSVYRLGWPTGGFLRQFLDRPELMDDHLSPYRTLMEKYQDRNDVGSATVLYGALNVVQWNQVKQNLNIRWHRFEDLCADPISQFRTIFDELSLPYSASTEQRHYSLCFGSGESPSDYRTHAVARNSQAMANSWKRQLDREQVAEIRSAWDLFDVDLYRSEDDWILSPPALEPNGATS
jgi:hypothetical protein